MMKAWKAGKNTGGGITPVKKTSQQLSAESTTEHQKSLHPFRVPFTARTGYGGSTPACGLSSLSGFHCANCYIIALIFIVEYTLKYHQDISILSICDLFKQFLLMFLTWNFLFRTRNKKFRIGNKSLWQVARYYFTFLRVLDYTKNVEFLNKIGEMAEWRQLYRLPT